MKHEQSSMPSWVLRATLLVITGIVGTFLSIWLLVELQNLVLLLVSSLFLSFALEPLVNNLERRGMHRRLATGLLIAALLVGLIFFVAAMVPLVIDQVRDLIASAPSWVERISTWLSDWFGINIKTVDIIEELQQANISLGDTATSIASNVIDISGRILSGLFQLFTVSFFTYYFVAEGPQLRRKLLTLMPAKQQKLILDTWEIAMDKTGGYLYSRLLLGLISSIATFVVLSMIGVPFAVPLAIWMGFVSQFIPVVGTYIAAAVPLAVALLQSPFRALLFVIFVIVYQQIENYLLSPKITARTMQLHPAVAIGAAIAGATLRGPIGAILALPLAAILQAIIGTYITRHELIDDDSGLLGKDEAGKKAKRLKKAKAD